MDSSSSSKGNLPVDESIKYEFNGTTDTNIVGGDESILRQPLRTSLAGFQEAKKAYENGTDEVRRLLMQECAIIYECNVCRNMFRSLANFISHKRIYCKQTAEDNSFHSYSGHNSSVLIQTIEHQESRFNKSRSTGSSPVPTTVKSSNRDLSKIIERLKKVDVSSNSKKVSPEEKPQKPFAVLDAPDPVLQLERVPTTTKAVYQTLTTTQNTCDSIKTELEEVHNLTNQQTFLGADGKAIINHNFMAVPVVSSTYECNELSPDDGSNYKNINVSTIACEICKMPFQTEKTLKLHVEKKHTSSTYVFQCPTCSLTFLQPAAVIRHLANEHKKPMRRIRKMRDTILKKRIQIGDVQVRGPSREVKRLKMNEVKSVEDNIIDENRKLYSTCTYCKKNFDRRAVLSIHMNTCPARKYSPKNKVEISSKPSSSSLKNPKADTKQTNLGTPIGTIKQLDQDIKDRLKKHGFNYIEGVDDNIVEQKNRKVYSTCTFCKKNFVNENVLSKHLKICPDRKNSSNKEETSTKLSSNNAKVDPKQNKSDNQVATNPNLHNQNQNQKDEIKKIEKIQTLVKIKQEPQEELNSMTRANSINEMFENLERQTFGNGLQTVSLDRLDIMVENKEREDKEIKENVDDKPDHNVKLAEDSSPINDEKIKPKRFRIVPPSKQLTCRCKICNKQFNALSNLRRHISMFHYRSRRFGCNLCDYRAFRRYDIVNHLTFVHKMSGERETMAVEHVTVHDIKYSKDDVEGDIVVVNELACNEQQHSLQVPQDNNTLKTYEKRGKHKQALDSSNKEEKYGEEEHIKQTSEGASPAEISHINVVRKKIKKTLTQQVEVNNQQKRPIRNRVKTVNNDFVYDLPTALQEEIKEPVRLVLKRRNTIVAEHKNSTHHELSQASIKITPYRLRTEPLIPASREVVKGFSAIVYRNVIQEALAAPSTLPDLPTARPQMRSRLISASRTDSTPVPVIETSELEAACLKSTLFDDSFLEKFAKKSNPSFRMKPLLALQHSPLSTILQKFDTTLLNSTHKVVQAEETTKTGEYSFLKPLEKLNNSLAPSSTDCGVDESLEEVDSSTPNGKHILEPSSPPSAPKKRITLMQRLAENRKQRDSLLRNALEN